MANKPKSMHQIRQILEHFKRGTGRNKMARLLSMSRNTIVEYRKRCALTGFSYEELLSLDDADLSAMLRNIHPPQASADDTRYRYLESRFSYFEAELRKTGVTKRILWEEYLKEVPDGYRYTRFCHFISQYDKKNGAVMRLVHLPGEELQVDFAGDKLSYIDKSTGEVIECEVLVCAMPYSHYMYAVALPSQKQDDFIAGLVKALHFLGAVPQVIKCDNLKSAVIKPDRYTPEFTQAMEYFAAHYGATAMATRVAKPRDKASVEKAVDVCYKRIYAPLRNQQFYSLNELNQAIIKQLNWHNDLPLQGKSYSRTQRFTQDEYPAMKALPAEVYSIKHSTISQVGKNYHVILGEDRHHYSVPYRLISKKLKLVYTTDQVEIYDGFNRVALHQRNYRKHGFTTLAEHMPQNHKHAIELGGYTADMFMEEAKSIGPHTTVLVEKMLKRALYVQHTSGMYHALIRLKKNYGKDRLEEASRMLHQLNNVTCKALENVLCKNLDKQEQEHLTTPIPSHENTRGASSYA